MDFLFSEFIFALYYTWLLLLPHNFLLVFSQQFCFCNKWNLGHFWNNVQSFFKFIEWLNPILIFFLALRIFICLIYILKIQHVQINVLWWCWFLFWQGVNFYFAVKFIRLRFYCWQEHENFPIFFFSYCGWMTRFFAQT